MIYLKKQTSCLITNILLLIIYILIWFNFSDCGSTTIANGEVTHSSVTTYGAQANISCDVGYNVTGTGIIECLDTGLWDQNSSCLIIGMIFFMVFNYDLVYVCKLRLHHFKDSPTSK